MTLDNDFLDNFADEPHQVNLAAVATSARFPEDVVFITYDDDEQPTYVIPYRAVERFMKNYNDHGRWHVTGRATYLPMDARWDSAP